MISARRKRLSNKQREELWDRCRGEREHPLCNLCSLEIQPGQKWHESHYPKPHWLGGTGTGVAHSKCNLTRAHEIETPLFHKNNRMRQKHIGAFRTSRPMSGNRDSNIRKKINGQVVSRATGEPWSQRR